MTVLLVCNKKARKKHASNIARVNAYNHIATITLVKSDIVATILEHNPHILAWIDDVEYKKDAPDYARVVLELRSARPNLRIMTTTNFGEASNVSEEKEAVAPTPLSQMTTLENVNITPILSSGDVLSEYLTMRDGAFDFDTIVEINC
jgi:hypothetical protein